MIHVDLVRRALRLTISDGSYDEQSTDRRARGHDNPPNKEEALLNSSLPRLGM